MKHKTLTLLVGVLSCASISVPISALAAKASKMTCKDFIALDEVSRPKAYYWAEGYNRFGEDEEIIDFGQRDRLIPIVVEECTKNPTHALVKKVKEVKDKKA